ncbi:hypothetical protein ABTH30_22085, partial [Acinetobacter baumannii]
HGPQAAQQLFALDAAHPIEELDKNMPALLSDARAVYYALGQDDQRDAQLQRWLQGVRALARSGVSAPGAVVDVSVLLDDMRLFKDA